MQNPHNVSSSSKPRIGLIQSRGLGDIVIALPIAKWYHDLGFEVIWPIDEKFYPSFKDSIRYVKFIPFQFKQTISGFYTTPLELLRANNCTKIINLYSYIGGLAICKKSLSNSLSFDQYKYAISDVPFKEKWNLSIKRNLSSELKLYNNKITDDKYIVVHNKGSDITMNIQVPIKYKDHQVVFIDESTDSIFDWLHIIENAKCLFMIDSCFSNLVDQLQLQTNKYFALRSAAQFTPVLMANWNYIKN